MNNYYSTSDVAKRMHIHPNTVRLYEKLGLITRPERQPNGYRIFTKLHLKQFQIARLVFEVEILQNGLRKKAVEIVKTVSNSDINLAFQLTESYLSQLEEESQNAEKAIQFVEQIISGKNDLEQGLCMTRKETAQYLHVTIDTLRNWELNGLLTVKRKMNGYRIYTDSDIQRLTIIKSLRCANYSLSAILRMLHSLSSNPQANIQDIRYAIDTSKNKDDIITACDSLLTSLNHAKTNANKIYILLNDIKNCKY